MKIDHRQPIMFDKDGPGGHGAGYWQANPLGAFQDDIPKTRLAHTRGERVLQFAVGGAIISFILCGWIFG
jgi:hypothetical protein